MATVGAAGRRRNEAAEPRASSHEEGSADMRVYQARGGVAGTAQAAKAGGHPEETAARGGRGRGAGRGGRVANEGDTGEEGGVNSKEGCGGGTREDIPESGGGA